MQNGNTDLKAKQNNPLVSIIVPIYNVESYLPQCIESICNQNYENLEIILVDDASTDSSGEICDSYGEKDKRICVIHKQVNGGLVAARKTGMRVASGAVIGNVDGDDWIEPDMFKTLVNVYLRDYPDIVQSGFIENGGKNKVHSYGNFTMALSDYDRCNILEKWMDGYNVLVGSQIFTKLYCRELFLKCYEKVPDNMSNGEDFIFFVIFMKKVKKISSIDKCFYNYRVRQDSLSHNNNGVDLLLKEDNLSFYIMQILRDNYLKISNNNIEEWFLKRKLSQLKSILKQYDFDIPLYKYAHIEALYGKKIIVYGAGAVGRDYIMQISEYEQIDIVMWVDKNPEQYSYPFRKVSVVDSIKGVSFDYIIIAIRNEIIANQVREELIQEYNILSDNILWDNNDFKVLKQ